MDELVQYSNDPDGACSIPPKALGVSAGKQKIQASPIGVCYKKNESHKTNRVHTQEFGLTI